jgi:hypothetical protein
MTTLIPQLEDELRRAAERGASSTAAQLAPSGRRLRIAVLGLGLSLAISAGAYAARGLWTPQLGNDTYGHPVAVGGALPAWQTERFAVLRREQTAADRGPLVQELLRRLDPALGEVRTDAVRKVATLPDGGVVVLIPTRVEEGFDPEVPDMKRDVLCTGVFWPTTGDANIGMCVDEVALDARQAEFSQTPLTRSQHEAELRFLNRLADRGTIQRFPGAAGAPTRFSVVPVEEYDRYTAAVGLAPDDRAYLLGVVPDEVRHVRARGYATRPVRNNMIVVPVALRDVGLGVDWLAADGEVIPIKPPHAG